MIPAFWPPDLSFPLIEWIIEITEDSLEEKLLEEYAGTVRDSMAKGFCVVFIARDKELLDRATESLQQTIRRLVNERQELACRSLRPDVR
jgi:hypothetical protein